MGERQDIHNHGAFFLTVVLVDIILKPQESAEAC